MLKYEDLIDGQIYVFQYEDESGGQEYIFRFEDNGNNCRGLCVDDSAYDDCYYFAKDEFENGSARLATCQQIQHLNRCIEEGNYVDFYYTEEPETQLYSII